MPKIGPEKVTDMLSGPSMSELPGKGFWMVMIDQVKMFLWPRNCWDMEDKDGPRTQRMSADCYQKRGS